MLATLSIYWSSISFISSATLFPKELQLVFEFYLPLAFLKFESQFGLDYGKLLIIGLCIYIAIQVS